jgi:hypothetical protein
MKLYILELRGRVPTYLYVDPEWSTFHFGQAKYATLYTWSDAQYVRNGLIALGASPISLIVKVQESNCRNLVGAQS